MTFVTSQCWECRHFHNDNQKGNFCDAFPEPPGIPREILKAEFDHTLPYPGDNGVRFEPVEERELTPAS